MSDAREAPITEKGHVVTTYSLRILCVGNFGRKSAFRCFYNIDHKLANGFIRNGHNVVCFSDRDHAREATVFGSQKLGKKKMAEKLLETAKNYKPHLVLFGHCDLFGDELYLRMKELRPEVRLATFCVDAVFRTKTMESFARRAEHCNAAFITTADKAQLSKLGIPLDKLHFMPNPVDPSIETARVFERPLDTFDWDGQFLGTGIGKREEQLNFIAGNLPDDYQFRSGGRAFGSDRIEGVNFLECLTEAPVSPNLPLDDTDPSLMPYLYSSDRIAQLLGQGVTTLVPKAAGLSDLYDEGVVEYSCREELVECMVRLKTDDQMRRKIGEVGWRMARDRTALQKVASDICFTSMQ